MWNDPSDKAGIYDYLRQRELVEKDKPFLEMDKTLGYERTLKRQKEQNPELYEAWVLSLDVIISMKYLKLATDLKSTYYQILFYN